VNLFISFFSKKTFLFILSVIAISFLAYSIFNYFYWLNYKPIPGSCKILEERYCKTVTYIYPPWKKDILTAAYSLPPGTPIFAPFQQDEISYFSKGTPTIDGKQLPIPYIPLIQTDKIVDNIQNSVSYYLYFDFHKNQLSKNISLGQKIDTVQSTYLLGNYNLLVVVINTSSATVHPSSYKNTSVNITKKKL